MAEIILMLRVMDRKGGVDAIVRSAQSDGTKGGLWKEMNCPRRHKTCVVQSLSQEGPLEKETATHSSVLAW